MKAITFDGCLGWLHEGCSAYGVVLCEPLGHEALWTHKLMRAFAERLADEGLWVLRFNYPCAGDSLGDDIDAERFSKSVDSIHRAIATLRAHAPISDLTLLGIRAGASFAMLAAAAENDSGGASKVDALVALSPVVRGRSYMRELSLIQQQWLETAPPAVQQEYLKEHCVSILGHRYPTDLVDEIRALNLSDAVNNASSLPRAVLLVDTNQGDSPALCTALQSRGVEVSSEVFLEFPATMREGTRSRLPLKTIDSIAHWIVQRMQDGAPTAGHDTERAKSYESAGTPVALIANGISESLVSVGPAQLSGILCGPTEIAAARPGSPTLLIASTASNPRTADGRVAVRLAREMAHHGITTLRVDMRGIGDSGAQATDDQSGIPYSDRAIEDIATAADWLAAQGHRDIIAFGICSGAYASLHAATKTTSLAGVIAINLARFIWPRGMTLDDARKQQTNSTRGYLASVRNWRKWRRLICERRDPRPVLRELGKVLIGRMGRPLVRIAERFGWQPPAGTALGIIHHLARRGAKVLFVYGEFDPGVDELNRYFGPVRRAFKRWRQVRVRTMRQLDHSLYGTSGADAVIDLCVETLTSWSEWKTENSPGSNRWYQKLNPTVCTSEFL